MGSAQAVVNIGQRGTLRHLESLGFKASLLPQPREQTHPNCNRHRHEAILGRDEDVDFLT